MSKVESETRFRPVVAVVVVVVVAAAADVVLLGRSPCPWYVVKAVSRSRRRPAQPKTRSNAEKAQDG